MDRYATEGYGEPVGLLEQIDKAGAVGDLSVVDLNWPFAGFDGTLDDVKAALARNNLRAVAITPEIYNKDYIKGSITNPDPAVRAQALALLNEATELAKELGCDYVKLWFGQDGWDYPFQVNYHDVWTLAIDGLRELCAAHPDIKFVIEYKPREPRNKIIFPNAARTLLAIQQAGCDNLGVLLDFGHSLYGLETPADAAQLCIDARQAVRDRRQRQLPRLGRRHGGRLGPPGRDVRVLPHPAAETTGTGSGSSTSSRSERTRCRPPSRRSPSSRRSTAPSTRSTRRPSPQPRPDTTPSPPRSWCRRCCSAR